MVIAATGDESLNHEIAELCRARGIPINSVDQPEDCTFIFPSYIRKQNLVGAISSGGNSPVLTQYLKERLSHELTDELGEIGEYMGDIRAYVREEVPEEGKRRQLYRRILNELIENGETSLPKERLLDLISEIQQ
jgi:uroporphyrin-III C-methyltransferase/precorrin-2 dehydrogenase/sirohydrochlorin ferrochelatase/precorrin-2 dehydrogenase/sirohydrochlorin ferrochelatase